MKKTVKPPSSWLAKIRAKVGYMPHSHDELLYLLSRCEQHHLLDQQARHMIEGVLNVSSQQVRDVMIPRAQMVVLEMDMTLQDAIPIIVASKHSRFPVIGQNKDEVKGIMLSKEIIYHLEHLDQPIHSILYPATFVPESKRLDNLLQEFKKNHNHMVIVVDEYGGVSGLVTIEDIVEQIVGDIEDEHFHEEDALIKTLKPHHYLVNGLTPLSELSEALGQTFKHKELDTIGGYMAQRFGRIPSVGESLKLDGFMITIKQVDQRRIRMLELKKIA